MAIDLGRVAEAPEEVHLLRFEGGAPGGAFPVVARLRGKIVGPDLFAEVPIKPGSWWYCTVIDKDTFYLAHPIKEFDIQDVLHAKPELLRSLFPYLDAAAPVPSPPKPAAIAAAPPVDPSGFVTLPRAERVEVTEEGILLRAAADLLEGSTHCELLVDRGRSTIALRPTDRPDGWPVKDGMLRSREVTKALPPGEAWARWSDRLGLLIVTRDL